MNVFTSGRDYRPHAAFGNRVPPNAVYVRVLVAAESFDAAAHHLAGAGLGRYVETLRGPNAPDGPSDAIEAYVREFNVAAPCVFVLYRIDQDVSGAALTPPRMIVAQLRDGEMDCLGRVLVVGMGRLDQPRSACRIMPHDKQDDPVPLVGRPEEGPTDDVPLVEGPIPYPDGALGYLTKGRERRIIPELVEVRADLALVMAAIDRASRSTDPRVSWGRQSGQLLDLSRRLAAAAADAATVETILQAGA